jgi:hypothetical protein
MKTRNAPDNPLTTRIRKWKKDQAIISLTIDEMEKEAKGKQLIIEQKVDGQSAILDYSSTEEPKFGSLGGVLYWDLPLGEDITKIFKAKKITQAKIVGEMAGYDGKKIIPFNETESIIKNPKADKTLVHWFPYQILELNGEKIPDDFKTYKANWPELVRIFKGSKYVHPVEYYEGGIAELKKAWNKLVLKEKNEGIVVRTSDNRVYKSKPTFTYDLAILAVGSKKGKNWPKKKIGMTLMAFMDKDRVFRTAGHIGTGWNEAEAKELFSWAQKNKVGEDDTYIWVKPEKIVEVQWERTSQKEMPSYKYEKGKYEPVGKKMSGTIVKPRFIRYRTDKSVNPNDLRLTQIPDWGKKQMMAHKVAQRFLQASLEIEARLTLQDLISKVPGAPRTIKDAIKVLIDAAKKMGSEKVLKIMEGVQKKAPIMMSKEAGMEDLGGLFRLFGYPILVIATLVILLLGGAHALDQAKHKIQEAQQVQIEQVQEILKG